MIMDDVNSTNEDDGPTGPTPGRCNAQRRQGPAGGLCREWAGKGTGHVGTGRCRRHGGNAPTGRVAAAREHVEDQFRRFGQILPVRPLEALRDEIGRTAGIIAIIESEIDRTVTEDGGPVLVDTAGLHPAPAPLVSLHLAQRQQLVRAAEAAVRAGVETAMTDLHEAYQDRALDVAEMVAADLAAELGLDPNSPQVIGAVGRALARLDGGNADRPAIGGVA